MLIVLLRWMAPLSLLWGAAIAVVHVLPYQHVSPLHAFLSSSDGCEPPCFMGIRPGKTRLGEALRLLEAHPWVSEVTSYDVIILWEWSGAQPDWIDSSAVGLLYPWSGTSITNMLIVRTTIPFGDVWLTLGEPEKGLLLPAQLDTEPSNIHLASYRGLHLQVRSDIPCRDLHPAKFWTANTQLALQSGVMFETLTVKVEFEEYNWGLLFHHNPFCSGDVF